MSNKTDESEKEEHWFSEFKRFALEFKSESDRAAVILGAAKLDISLYQVIERFLLPCSGGRDELLEGDSPLATFSARINLCHRLGLISDECARALHLVRRIRNSFAHELSGISLASGAHRDRIKELVGPILRDEGYKTIIEDYFEGSDSPAAQFRAAVALMSLRLEGLFDRMEAIDPPETCRLVHKKEQNAEEPNKTPEPTTTAVTPPAAQEPRQP